MPTIRQIAKACKVSPMTVSFVLNNKPGQVSEDTRQRVLRTMREMGYRPRASTRVPADTPVGSHTIGIAVGRYTEPMRDKGYFSFIFSGIVQAAEAIGYSTLLFHSGLFREDPHRSIRTYFDGRCDGLLVIAPSPNMPLVAALAERGVPFVLIGDQGDGEGISSVDVENVGEAEVLVDWLVEMGHQRIAFIGGAEEFARCATQRHEGYRRGLAKHGIPLVEAYELAPLRGEEFAYEAVAHLLRRKDIARPTALIGWNDNTAMRALMAVQDARLRVPQDISVIGFDDEARAAQTNPPLTTVRQPYREIAAKAVEMLLARVRRSDTPAEQVYLPTRLIERDSVAPPSPEE